MQEVSQVAARMGVDEKELEARMEFLGLDQDTLRLLGELHQRFETQRPVFIEIFYDKLRNGISVPFAIISARLSGKSSMIIGTTPGRATHGFTPCSRWSSWI